jgi:hypothetical protein
MRRGGADDQDGRPDGPVDAEVVPDDEIEVEVLDVQESAPSGRRIPSPAALAFVAAGLVLLVGIVITAVTVARAVPDRPAAPAPEAGGPGTPAASEAASPPTTTPASDTSGGAAIAAQFLSAWEQGRYGDMQALVADQSDDVDGAYRGLAERLGITAIDVTPGSPLPATGSVPYGVTVTLGDHGPVTWRSTVPVVQDDGTWRVRWTADTLFPGLQPGQRLDLRSVSVRGTIADRDGRPLSADSDLAANLVGRSDVGERTGLERVLDVGLDLPGGTAVVLVDATSGQVVRRVAEWRPTGEPPVVRTTIDLDVQRAAGAALAQAPGRSALVALDPASGEVLAVANRPVEGLPIALTGAYPPGSTFTIVTAAAALESGTAQSDVVDCPATHSAGGRTFRNDPNVPTGPMTVTDAFATSCDTAFIGLAERAGFAALREASAAFGFDTGPPLPIASRSGSLPDPTDPVTAAANSVGQGAVTASPLHMATVAAAAASGVWRQPQVLPCPECAARTVPSSGALRELMRAAVVDGTGRALDGVPGGPVSAKAGTAEGPGGVLHAWVAGWQGDVAFAVLVEGGGTGTDVAVPVAARFLSLLAD